VRDGRQHPDPRIAASRRISRRFRCCWPPAPCTTTSCAKSSARSAGSSARPERRARSRTWRSDRLRRGRDQPVPRAPDDPGARAGRTFVPADRSTPRRSELHQGQRQGPAQDLREDGDLDAPELPRSADLRERRARPRSRGPLLHGTASRVSGVGYDVLARETRCATSVPSRAMGSIPSSIPAGSISGARAASATRSIQTRREAAARRQAGSYEDFKEFSKAADDDTERMCTLRGSVPLPVGGRAASARGGRAGRGHRAALLHRCDVVRLDLD
jgi:hypothetical protein